MTLEKQLETIDTDMARRVGYQIYVEYEIEGDNYGDGEQIRWCDTFPVYDDAAARRGTHERIIEYIRCKFAHADDEEQKIKLMQVSVYWYHPRDGHQRLHTIKAMAGDLPIQPTCSHCGARKPQRRSEPL